MQTALGRETFIVVMTLDQEIPTMYRNTGTALLCRVTTRALVTPGASKVITTGIQQIRMERQVTEAVGIKRLLHMGHTEQIPEEILFTHPEDKDLKCNKHKGRQSGLFISKKCYRSIALLDTIVE